MFAYDIENFKIIVKLLQINRLQMFLHVQCSL